jgi:glyoxylase-like metal-dependent hydrolase (beta-lactamase superfamily II)
VIAAPRSIHRYPYRWLMWGVPEPAKVEALPDVIETPHLRIRVIPTPGHTRDHVIFFEPETRTVFTGDLFTGPRVRQARRVENVSDQITSLELLRDLRPRLMICYHKGPVENPGPALEAKIDFMRTLRDDARRLRDKGQSPRAIARRLLGRETPRVHTFTMGDYTKVRLIKAALHPPGYYPVPIG